MTLIDYEVHNNEVQERNALIQEARELIAEIRALKTFGDKDTSKVVPLRVKLTKFMNESEHAKYEHTTPKKEY